MKKYVLIIIFSPIFIYNLSAQRLSKDSQRMQAMVKKDTLLLQQIIDDSLLYIHSNGLQESKNDFIASIKSGNIQYEDMKILERISHSSDRKNQAFTGKVLVSGRYKGEPFQVKLAFTSHYRRHGKKFKLVYWQSTKLNE